MVPIAVCMCVRSLFHPAQSLLILLCSSFSPSLFNFSPSASRSLFFLFHRPCLFLVTFLIFFPYQVHVPPLLFLSTLPHLGQLLFIPAPASGSFLPFLTAYPPVSVSPHVSCVLPLFLSFSASHAQLLCSLSCFLRSVLSSQLRVCLPPLP